MSIGGRSKVPTPARRLKPTQAIPVTLAPPETCETFPNDGDLGTVASDLTWTIGAGVAALISSGTLGPNPTQGYGRAETGANITDMFVQADIVSGGVFYEVELIGRLDDAADPFSDADGILVDITFVGGATQLYFGTWQNGPFSGTTTLAATSAIATWRLELEGTEARVYRDDVLAASEDFSALDPQPSGKKGGVYFVDGGPVGLDTFCVGDLT